MGQVHRTNAFWLHAAIRKNPLTRFVLLHCSYPWIQDVMALVELYPNVFPDLSMLTLISTQASKLMLHDLIEAATADKITWGCDTWTPEESYGSLLAFRHALASVLAEKVSIGYCTFDDAQEIVDNVMFHNANRFYRLGL
jgi:predicted TIM-barrel fold metal-dependent hydrolase